MLTRKGAVLLLQEGHTSGNLHRLWSFWGAAEIRIFRSPHGRMRGSRRFDWCSYILRVAMSHVPDASPERGQLAVQHNQQRGQCPVSIPCCNWVWVSVQAQSKSTSSAARVPVGPAALEPREKGCFVYKFTCLDFTLAVARPILASYCFQVWLRGNHFPMSLGPY